MHEQLVKYFNQNNTAYIGWDHRKNTIINYNTELSFNDISNQQALKDARLLPAWCDWGLLSVGGLVGGGFSSNLLIGSFVNSLRINKDQ